MISPDKIGIDLGGSKIAGIVLGHTDKVLFENRLATPRGNYRAVVQSIVALVDQARAVCQSEPTVGIGIPGSLSPQTGRIQNANSTWMNGQDFQNDITAALGQSVKIANDANCLALSENLDGAAVGAKTVFAVIIGTGCGGGLVVDGKAVTGRHAIAGEWGHAPLPWPNNSEFPAPQCWCGRRGCLEMWISGSGIERDCRATTTKTLSAEEISSLATSDPECRRLVDDHCDRLARGLAMVVNILDPDVIVLGGGLSKMDHLYDKLPGLMAPYIFADHFNPNIKRPVHGDASGVRGAARLWD